ncbi:esterase OVCA2-like isoform X2 [Haemaphysalis longicornis]
MPGLTYRRIFGGPPRLFPLISRTQAFFAYMVIIFIDAPHLIEDYVEPDGGNAGLRGWWFSTEAACPYTQQAFEKSVKTVEEACKLQGPFDGVLGFSQGAAFTAILLAMQSLGKVECGFKFGVLVSGFHCEICTLDDPFVREGLITVPTLHILGEADTIIPKARSMEFLHFFVSPTILCHPGGHFMPTTSQSKEECIAFFKKVAAVCANREPLPSS